MRIGSLFSGAGGLDLAVEAVFGGTTVWHSEIDKAASKVLAYRWPEVPNLGSVTEIDWAAVEPVDLLCGGFPCQDVSAAGKRAGIKDGTRSGLWSVFAEAIDVLRPQFVVIENVRGLLSAAAHRTVEDNDESGDMESGAAVMGDGSGRPVLRAAGAVLGDLADLGYDAAWTTFAAGDVGAPHRRERVFILAIDTTVGGRDARLTEPEGLRRQPVTGTSGDRAGQVTLLPTPTAQAAKNAGDSRFGGGNGDVSNLWQIHHLLLPTPRSSDCFGAGLHGDGGMDLRTTVTLLPSPRAIDGNDGGGPAASAYKIGTGQAALSQECKALDGTQWGKYEPAIRRWESLTRSAPPPTEPNKNGNPRLAAAFSEWLMGWPEGWVTDPAIGISRNDQLRIVGNGVCSQQAAAALRYLLSVSGGGTPINAPTQPATKLLPTPCARDHKDGDSAGVHARNTPSLGAVSAYFGEVAE